MLDVVAFGELLWDVIDGEALIGGAPFNLAAHAARCGLKAAVVSRVGDDALGRAALAEMVRLGVDPRWAGLDARHPTGTVTVSLSAGQPSYAIHEGVAWDYIQPAEGALQLLAEERPRVLCFGTLAQRSEVSRRTLARLLELCPFDEVFYDVNLRQHYWSAECVEANLARASLVKVNDEEARVLGERLYGGAASPEAFAHGVLERHHAVRAVVVTLGAEGCLVRARGQTAVRCPGVKVAVADAVGAGDAFSAAFLAARLNGASAAEAGAAGNARGAWVASRRGAVPEEPVGQASSPVPCSGRVGQASSPVPPHPLHAPRSDEALPGQAGTPVPLFKPFDPRAVRKVHCRHLPHWEQAGATYFVTWRLADSLPHAVTEEWHEALEQWLAVHPQPWDSGTEDEYWTRFVEGLDEGLDRGLGSCLLKEAAIASEVEESLLHCDGAKYRLWRYVIMPNHVHVLVTPLAGASLSCLLHGWKGYTAKVINQLRGTSGTVWQDETFDHIVRRESQLAKFVSYIEANPEKARVTALVGPANPPALP